MDKDYESVLDSLKIKRPQFCFDLQFSVYWDSANQIRDFITSVLSNGIVDTETATNVAMAACELMENVYKNTALGGARITMEKDKLNSRIVLAVKNVAKKDNIKVFSDIFSLVHKEDAEKSYLSMMRRAYNREGVSQLGLARIRYECNAVIDYQTSESGVDFIDLLGELEYQDYKDRKNELEMLKVIIKIPVKFNF